MDNGNEWKSTHISKNENVLYLKKECSFSSAASLSPEPSLSLGSLIRSRPRRFFASCKTHTQERRGGVRRDEGICDTSDGKKYA
jgi:hypothetical protein